MYLQYMCSEVAVVAVLLHAAYCMLPRAATQRLLDLIAETKFSRFNAATLQRRPETNDRRSYAPPYRYV